MDESITRLAHLLESKGALRAEIERQRTEVSELTRFLKDGALDEKLLNAAATANGYLRDFARMGIVGSHPTLSEIDLSEEMRGAKDSIRITASWTGCLISLGEILVEKARSGCDVRILILRHNSEFARLRGQELDPVAEHAASRQIATEICEFNRLFRHHPDVKSQLQVKAFDARPSMCMFARDDTRVIGSLWPGINAMDAPVLRVVGDGDPALMRSLGRIADKEFERIWNDEKTLYITVVDGEPQYTEMPEMAWSVDGQHFASVLEDLERATQEGGDLGRSHALSAIKSNPDRVQVTVLELHERLRSNDPTEAVKIADALEEIDELHAAEVVLREAVNCGYVQFVEHLARLQLKAGNDEDAERTLRRGVSAGNYFAIFRLVKLLGSTGRYHEVERVLRDGVQAGSIDALRNLVDLLDRSGRSPEADRILEQKYAEGIRAAGHLLTIREYNNGNQDRSLGKLREWAQEGDDTAQGILQKLEVP
ncbi:DUF5919 domain-containing protein [Actinophytocola gossypii]|uniref:DUF5919 domain-containing protein n=1 Tax=Actinophytocola gossypii TaxID=2812003 RepID=A0ABT2J720_9PSEU|nr:DUF5919 domain-containing protein [Actinophytocola gossypii]MCT2583650.1 hypothetical protein [Actinophytocola gossypii]